MDWYRLRNSTYPALLGVQRYSCEMHQELYVDMRIHIEH